MPSLVFRCAPNSYRTPAERAGAVAHWVQMTAAQGAWPRRTWTAADHGAATGLAGAMGQARFGWTSTHWTRHISPTFSRGHWTFSNASWLDVFHSLVADSGVGQVHGRTVEQGLALARTASTRFRLVAFRCPQHGVEGTTDGYLAAVVDGGRLHLFDPHVGLDEFSANEIGADAPAAAFAALLSTRYGPSTDRLEAVTYALDVQDVFFTYFGPPKTTIVPDQWPDIKGPVSLVRAQAVPGTSPHRVKLGVLPAHLAAFRARLAAQAPNEADRIEVFSIPSVFPGWPMVAGTGDPLENAVSAALSQDTADLANIRALVSAKNLWSLWCTYRYGGYHLDAGVVAPAGRVALARPGPFAAMIVPDGNIPPQPAFARGKHRFGRFGNSGVGCIATNADFPSMTVAWTAAGFDTTVKHVVLTGEYYQLDAPVVSAARDDHGAGVALRFFLDGRRLLRTNQAVAAALAAREASSRAPIRLWNQAGQQAHESAMGRLAAERDLIVASLCAGVNHRAPTLKRCGVRPPVKGVNALWIADLGLRKTGAVSHRHLTDAAGTVLPGPWFSQPPAGGGGNA